MSFFRFLGRFKRSTRGVAAVEMAIVASVLSFAMLNAIEIGRYAYLVMQTKQASEAGVQAAYVACDSLHLPATENCSNLTDAVTTAIQSTSLGSRVTLKNPIAEGYYCLNSSGALAFASDVNHKPFDCAAFGNSAEKPILYLQVTTTYSFDPLFGMSVVAALPAHLDHTSWMRMI